MTTEQSTVAVPADARPGRRRARPKKYKCTICGFVYDEAAGDPEHGIAAGTSWQDVPESWSCPDCGVAKADFEMVEM